MTRKRFIKLAMSYYLTKNQAEAHAALVGHYGSYAKLYRCRKTFFIGHAISVGFKMGVKRFLPTLAAAGEAACVVGERLRSALSLVDIRPLCRPHHEEAHGLRPEIVVFDELSTHRPAQEAHT